MLTNTVVLSVLRVITHPQDRVCFSNQYGHASYFDKYGRKTMSTLYFPRIRLCGFAGFVFFLLLSGCASIVRPNFETEVVKLREGQYTLDARHSFVLFKVAHLGLSTYVGRFNTFSASMDFDPAAIDDTKIEGLVELGSIDTGDPEVDELLSSDAWFNVEEHPQAFFKTTSVSGTDDGNLSVEGELTLNGITDTLTMQGKFNGGADNLLTRRYTIGFTAQGVFSRSQFSIDKFKGLVGDDVQIELFAEFLRN